jgi:hypothetical protein
MYRHVAARRHSWPSPPSELEVDPLRVRKRSGVGFSDLIVIAFETGSYALMAVWSLGDSLLSSGWDCSPSLAASEVPYRMYDYSRCLLRTAVTPGRWKTCPHRDLVFAQPEHQATMTGHEISTSLAHSSRT